MAARTSPTPRPSTQTPPEPPSLSDDAARVLATLPRKGGQGRRSTATGEVWLQCDDASDGWLRARVVQVAPGWMALLAHRAPALGRGTWAVLAAATDPSPHADQVRVFPLGAHAVGPDGPVLIECETPVDPALIARFLR